MLLYYYTYYQTITLYRTITYYGTITSCHTHISNGRHIPFAMEDVTICFLANIIKQLFAFAEWIKKI